MNQNENQSGETTLDNEDVQGNSLMSWIIACVLITAAIIAIPMLVNIFM